jgi:5-methylcytosine-specific restriction enzyme A
MSGPQPRPEVVELLHNRRFNRHLSAYNLPHITAKGLNGRGLCKWCGQEVPKGRRCWCSQECVDELLVRSSSDVVRSLLLERDRGICARCGIDVLELEALRDKICYRFPKRFSKPKGYVAHWGPWFNYGFTLWEADHIVPVIEGGGCCGLGNFQILCLRCHKQDTADLAARRARRGGA